MKRKDKRGRVWEYNDAEGSWHHGEHTIGCGANNGSKFMIWDGPDRGHYEYKTLGEAMAACKVSTNDNPNFKGKQNEESQHF